MATAKMTLIGLYKYMQFPGAPNHNLFTKLNVPTGIDKDKLINTILYNGGEFEVLYADPDFFKDMIGIWSDKTQFTMERWAKALAIEYNPLENYDRMEEWHDTNNSVKSDLKTTTDERSTADNTVSVAASESEGSGSNENKKAAYDSSTYQPYEKAETSSGGKNTSNGAETSTGNLDETINEKGNEATAGVNDRTGRAHGNIGVTTSQQMLQSELDIARFNLYGEISNLFLTELCIYTY